MDVDARPCSSPVARSLSPPVNEPNSPDSPSHSLPQVEEDFITSLEILPELWNLRHIHYKNKYKREAGYKKLLKILKKIKPKATTEDVRKKINSLRSNYRRELKKITASKRSGAGADDLYTPKSKSFKLLSFLYNTEKSDNSPQDLITENAEANDDNTSEANTAKRSEYEHSSRPSFSSINPVISPSPLIKSKKQNSLVAKQNELLDRANLFLTQSTVQPQQRVQETTMSDSLAFVWANKLEKLHPQQRFFAEKAIHDILFEAGLGNLHRFSVKINENSSQSHYSPSPSLTNSRLKTNENFSQSHYSPSPSPTHSRFAVKTNDNYPQSRYSLADVAQNAQINLQKGFASQIIIKPNTDSKLSEEPEEATCFLNIPDNQLSHYSPTHSVIMKTNDNYPQSRYSLADVAQNAQINLQKGFASQIIIKPNTDSKLSEEPEEATCFLNIPDNQLSHYSPTHSVIMKTNDNYPQSRYSLADVAQNAQINLQKGFASQIIIKPNTDSKLSEEPEEATCFLNIPDTESEQYTVGSLFQNYNPNDTFN